MAGRPGGDQWVVHDAESGVILARRELETVGHGAGHRVHLSTTDPAAPVEATVAGAVDGLTVSRIDPAAETAAYTDQLALILDEWQYQRRAGPCLEAATGRTTVSVPDLADDGRWPDWGRHAVAGRHRASGAARRHALSAHLAERAGAAV